MPTVQDALHYAQQTLATVSDAPHYEARRLLSHLLNQTTTWLYTHPDASLEDGIYQAFIEALQQRATVYPLPYIIGEWGFYHWDFMVNEHVLIPRPETELLVELAHQWAEAYQAKTDDHLAIVDVGTGSGIIAISMALLIPNATVWAVDVSQEALAVAQQNSQNLNAKINFVQSSLLNDLSSQQFNLILANLPYIETKEVSMLAVAEHEPLLALDGGPDGLDLVRALVRQSVGQLAPHGAIMLEIGDGQGQAIHDFARIHYPTAQIDVIHDLNQRERVVRILTD